MTNTDLLILADRVEGLRGLSLEQARSALTGYGFSAFKAQEIALDCLRGDKYALSFLGLARNSLRTIAANQENGL